MKTLKMVHINNIKKKKKKTVQVEEQTRERCKDEVKEIEAKLCRAS